MDNNTKTLGPGWSRRQLSYRLTAQRKVDLLALCETLGAHPTPTHALDHALALARDFQRMDSSARWGGLEDLEVGLDARFVDIQESLARQELSADHIQQNLRGLHRLISALADGADIDGLDAPSFAARSPIPFRAWLEGALKALGHKVQRAAIARSTWQAVTASTPRMRALDLMAELIAVDGVAVPRTGVYPELARIDLIDASHPLVAVEAPRPLFLVCQAMANGWTVHAHLTTPDGKPGAAIGMHRI